MGFRSIFISKDFQCCTQVSILLFVFKLGGMNHKDKFTLQKLLECEKQYYTSLVLTLTDFFSTKIYYINRKRKTMNI